MSKRINIHDDVNVITVNIMGSGGSYRLHHFMSTEPPAPSEGVVQKVFEKVQLWENDQRVSAAILEKALLNNRYQLAEVLYNDTGKKEGHSGSMQIFKSKIIFKTRNHLENDPNAVKMDFTSEQREEIRRLLKYVYKYCHAQWFAGPIPNIQIAMLQISTEKPLRQITVRDGVMMTTQLKDLTEEEQQLDAAKRFITRLVGKA